jgi:DNA-binding IclR family transcriptional regulator
MTALLAALEAAGERGVRAEDLAGPVGMSVAWVFNRLAELKRGGQVRNANGRHYFVTSDREEGCATGD